MKHNYVCASTFVCTPNLPSPLAPPLFFLTVLCLFFYLPCSSFSVRPPSSPSPPSVSQAGAGVDGQWRFLKIALLCLTRWGELWTQEHQLLSVFLYASASFPIFCCASINHFLCLYHIAVILSGSATIASPPPRVLNTETLDLTIACKICQWFNAALMCRKPYSELLPVRCQWLLKSLWILYCLLFSLCLNLYHLHLHRWMISVPSVVFVAQLLWFDFYRHRLCLYYMHPCSKMELRTLACAFWEGTRVCSHLMPK